MLSAVPFLGQVAVEDKELRIKRKETRPFYFLTSFVFFGGWHIAHCIPRGVFFCGLFFGLSNWGGR